MVLQFSIEWNYYSDSFHTIFYEQAENSRLTDAARKIRIQSTLFSKKYELQSENRQDILNQHREILEALRQDNLQKAEECMRSHVASSYTKALATLEEE